MILVPDILGPVYLPAPQPIGLAPVQGTAAADRAACDLAFSKTTKLAGCLRVAGSFSAA